MTYRNRVGCEHDAAGTNALAAGAIADAVRAQRIDRVAVGPRLRHARTSSHQVRIANEHRTLPATQPLLLQRPQTVLLVALQHLVHQFHHSRQRYQPNPITSLSFIQP